MRRSIQQFLSAAAPIGSFLNSVKPAGAEWSREISVLEQKNITNLGAWKNLSPQSKAAINISPEIQTILNNAAQKCGAIGGKKIIIAYGSQTGTAESYAKMLGTYAISHGFEPTVCTMNEVPEHFTSNHGHPDAMIYVCSTYGTGEFPSNATTFWEKLSKDELPQLGTIPYTVFGLGNSHNDHFNAAAKNLSEKLKSMGAPSFLRMQLSCELQESGHDGMFRNWKKSLWGALGSTTSASIKATYDTPLCIGPKADKIVVRPGFIPAVVHQNSLMTPPSYEPHSRLLKIKIETEAQRRAFGEVGTISHHIQIFPRNSKSLIERAAKRLRLSLDDVVEITPKQGAPKSSWDFHKYSVYTILEQIVDLSGIPSRSVLEAFSTIANDAVDRARLEALAGDLSPNSQYERLSTTVFSVVDALEMFPSLDLTLADLLTLVPHVAPRSYSVAGDNQFGEHASFEILYSTPIRRLGDNVHRGLCSGYLDQVEPGDTLFVHLTRSNIPLPRDDAPCLLIALGTGIGSARAILEHRFNMFKKRGTVGKTHLFYGFRHSGKDNLFVPELTEMEKAGMLTVTYVASNDGAKFISPMDVLDRSIVDFLGESGEISYCGLGGSVPLLLENSLRRCGVDVASMRRTKRYHEEFYTTDVDTENLIKNRTDEKADTLAARFGHSDMFCFQCEQTFKGKGCFKQGVCGKTPRVAALQDLLIHGTKIVGFYAHELRQMNIVLDNVNRRTLYFLFSTLTNVNFDDSRFKALIQEVQGMISHLKAEYEKACANAKVPPKKLPCTPFPNTLPSTDELVDLGKQVGVLSRFGDAATQSAAGVSEMLMYGLKGIAAYTDHSLMNGKENTDIYEFMHRALSFLASADQYDLGKGLALCLEAGKINVTSMSLLYDSNSTLGVPKPTPVPIKPKPGKCILVSGHDLIILKGLLEETEKLGINVFTHGEMLPAHGYPELSKYKTLAGNFGGAWMRQAVEFPHFPGPILMTTNCLTEPHESYAHRIFTAGAVGWKNVPHIGDNMADISFDSLIAAAQEAKGFGEEKEFSYADPVGVRRPAQLTVGFGHETILSVAPTIIDEIKKGNITRFFVVGGCDGYEGDRSYYTQLVSKLPKTAVVLTVGCGKYRINHLDLGTIGNTGIPRILDMGQCNDSFGAVQVALALAKVLNCQVSDLPLSIVLSWFEQKAIAVLLSCLALGLKPIRVGPGLPAFITPDVLGVLVKDFGIKALGNVDQDLKEMLEAKGAS